MRSACIVLLLSAVAFAAAEFEPYPGLTAPLNAEPSHPQTLSDTNEFQDVVEYLNENASGNDIYDLIESFSDILDDVNVSDNARSLNSAVHNVFSEISWTKVIQYVQAKFANEPKFAKLFAMINDPKFRQLIDNVVNSKSVRGFLHTIETNGFTWPAFINFCLKAVCETALMSHNDQYTEGVCQSLKTM